jgi:phospholipid/cholesterol/gamma-HCH transport system substrate-binding protein
LKKAAGRIVALVALAAVVVAVVLLLTSSGGPTYQVTADFTNASQLVGGEVVTLGGTPVGKVTKIELADDGDALITFSVKDDFAPLKAGTTAQIRSFSLSGVANRQIELTLPPEGTETETIASGGSIDKSDTISEVDLDEIFNTLNPKTAADFKKVIKGFASTYKGKAATQANAGFKYLNPFLSTSRQTFAELTRDTPALEQLIVDGASLSHTLAAKRDDISSLVGNLDLMMNAIARQRTSLSSALEKLPDFMRNFNTTAVNLRAALDDVDPLVDASKPVAVRLKPFFANFRAAAHDLVPTVTDLDKIVEDPGRDDDLVDLTRLQPALAKIAVGPVRANGKQRQGAFPEGATALTDSLDELAFFRAYTPELTGWFDDFGHSGIVDANGGIGRIGTTFNTFTLGANDLPVVDLAGALATTGTDLFDINNYQRCPGSNERPAPDGSNPFTDPGNPASAGGPVKCDPSIIPPGN